MGALLDKRIVELHQEGLKSSEIANQLAQEIKSPSEYHDYYHFLIASDLYKTLVRSLAQQLRIHKHIPWYHIFFVIDKFQTEMQPTMINAFLSNTSEEDWNLLFGLSYWKEDERLIEIQNAKLKEYYQNQNNPQLDLEKELQMSQSQNSSEKEKEIIDALLELDAKNPFFQKLKSEYERKRSIETLNEYKESHIHHLYDSYHMKPEQKEMKEQVQKILKQLKKMAQKNPKQINDIAIFLTSTGYNDLALEFLENYLDTGERKWLYLELLLEAQQFFRCLTFVDQLFSEETLPSEDTFALIYAKARAYYGLKEYEKAKQTLEDLIKIKPRYRLAQELLSQWKAKGSI